MKNKTSNNDDDVDDAMWILISLLKLFSLADYAIHIHYIKVYGKLEKLLDLLNA